MKVLWKDVTSIATSNVEEGYIIIEMRSGEIYNGLDVKFTGLNLEYLEFTNIKI